VKTDKVDAHVLAQLLRCDFLPEVWQPDEATRLLRELTGRRSALVRQRTAMRNRIGHHAQHGRVLAMRLIEAPTRLFGSAGLEWLAKLQLDDQARLLVDSDLRQLEFLQKEIDTLDTELAKRAYEDESVKLLMTLPGVDVAVAQSMMAAWGDPKRFPDGDHAASSLGLVPSTKQSAERCYHGPITKQGNSQARWMLIQAAQHLGKQLGPLGHFFRRLASRKNYNIAVVAGARKLAVIGWHMVTTGEPYRYASPRSTETKLARLRVKVTGKRRKGGSPKGTKCVAKLPGGSRTIKPLREVCTSEGLPEPKPLAPGEQRVVTKTGSAEFVAQISAAQVVPRPKSPRSGQRRKGGYLRGIHSEEQRLTGRNHIRQHAVRNHRCGYTLQAARDRLKPGLQHPAAPQITWLRKDRRSQGASRTSAQAQQTGGAPPASHVPGRASVW